MSTLVLQISASSIDENQITLIAQLENSDSQSFTTTITDSNAENAKKIRDAYEILRFTILNWCRSIYGRQFAIAIHLNTDY